MLKLRLAPELSAYVFLSLELRLVDLWKNKADTSNDEKSLEWVHKYKS
jgi:hypothetical protein